MRKLHLKQLEELINTLDCACVELKKQKDNHLLNLCADIQDFVTSIFDYVENILGENTKLLQLLKELYEILYYISKKEAHIKQVFKCIRKIEIEVESLRVDQIEIAFFCYKASMSDAFESIYLSAKADPACDVYFIPIPYFDRKPDGSFGQMHLEGVGHYSDQFQLTDWQAYDVEQRKPDAIFIMNPYDGNNYVTSVHPNYYSSRLKNFTECLVYIEYGLPYWLYKHPCVPELEEEYRKNALLLPAHLHARYDITYAKALAEGYQPAFATHPQIAQQYGLTPKVVEEKFLALGSPKFDKIFNTTKMDYSLAEEWKRKIQDKKVILYNTSLGELLKSSSQQTTHMGSYSPQESWYFAKLRSIIDTFLACDDVVVWWRPHPLFETTLRSMRPDLLKEYLSIVEKFKLYGKGIFDESEDLHRALAWSDGMISDESSLLLLYAATGKPFYIPSITKALPQPILESGTDYHEPLARRLENMRIGEGANVGNWNICIWWDNFLEEDVIRNTKFQDYTKRFIDFIVHPENYPEAEEYKKLQLQMIQDFVVNADGTAGQKIYEFIKQKAMEVER